MALLGSIFLTIMQDRASIVGPKTAFSVSAITTNTFVSRWRFGTAKIPILKERLFGLSGNEGNHGEDVKELFYYLDATPTHSYLKGLYKYPQARFPYEQLREENQRRTRLDPEFELADTGIFNEGRYFDIFAEYAKQDVDDIFIRITVVNRGPEAAELTFLPTLWFRNTWAWCSDTSNKPILRVNTAGELQADHASLGTFLPVSRRHAGNVVYQQRDQHRAHLGVARRKHFYKDAFHEYLIEGAPESVNPQRQGTKSCAVYPLDLNAGAQTVLHFRLHRAGSPDLARDQWDAVFEARIREASEFYGNLSHRLERRSPQCPAASVCRAVLEQAVLPLCCRDVAEWR